MIAHVRRTRCSRAWTTSRPCSRTWASTGPVTLAVHDWGGMIGFGWALARSRSSEAPWSSSTLPRSRFPPPRRYRGSSSLGRDSKIGGCLIRALQPVRARRGVDAARTGTCRPTCAAPTPRRTTAGATRSAPCASCRTFPCRPAIAPGCWWKRPEGSLPEYANRPVFIGWGLTDFVFDKHFLEVFQQALPDAAAAGVRRRRALCARGQGRGAGAGECADFSTAIRCSARAPATRRFIRCSARTRNAAPHPRSRIEAISCWKRGSSRSDARSLSFMIQCVVTADPWPARASSRSSARSCVAGQAVRAGHVVDRAEVVRLQCQRLIRIGQALLALAEVLHQAAGQVVHARVVRFQFALGAGCPRARAGPGPRRRRCRRRHPARSPPAPAPSSRRAGSRNACSNRSAARVHWPRAKQCRA